jgi:phenylacetate-CoA ligase
MATPCACGRAYPRLSAIEGRWTGERLFGAGGRTFTMTALNTHAAVFDRVARFRIRQERPGEATVFVVPGPGFQAGEGEAIAREYGRRCAQSIRFAVEVVPALPLTGRGKFKFVEQLIPDEVQQALSEGKNEVA